MSHVTAVREAGLPSLPRKGSRSTDDLIYKKKKKKTRNKSSTTEERRPHRFTGRPRGYVRGKFKSLLTTSESSFTVAKFDSSSSSSDEEEKMNPDGPTSSPTPTQIAEEVSRQNNLPGTLPFSL